MADTRTRKGLVWFLIALGVVLIGGMVLIKIWFTATVFMPIEEEAAVVETEPLSPEETVARDMVTSTVSGTSVMPDLTETFDRGDYSRELAQFIPLEVGMDRYAANDELLLYYHSDPESGAKVSSTEQMFDGATIFLIRRTGIADDAIAAEESYAIYDAGQLIDFGSRLQCRRGATPNEWTTDLCP